jgi:glycosyltransferase involved in cell wall biosynthesis
MSQSHTEFADMGKQSNPLKVALIAGTLGLGGAEKQLFLMARALQMKGAVPAIFTLTRGEPYEQKLREHHISVEYVGNSPNRLTRLFAIRKAIARFKPHIIQSGHFYTNLYTVIAAYFCKAVGIGSVRNDVYLEQAANGFLGAPSLHLPQALIVNSWNAGQNAIQLGVRRDRIHILENVVDLTEFDRMIAQSKHLLFKDDNCLVMVVARLSPEKRLERFVMALSVAREKALSLNIKGVIVGEGLEMDCIKRIAQANGFDESTLCFLGRRDDIPALLKQAKFLVLTSDHEGFPNVLLEAMAAGLPVISTPAGDAPRIVEDGRTGFIVNFDDITGLAEKIILLASSPKLRKSMGDAGRRRVEQFYASPDLAERLLKIYALICQRQKHFEAGSIIAGLLAELPGYGG